MKSQFELAAAARPLFEPDIFTTCPETDSPLSRKTHPLRVWYNGLRTRPPSLRYASTPPWLVEPPAIESCPPSIAHTSISTKTGAIASTTCVCPVGQVVSSARIRSSPFPGRNASKRNEITSRQSNMKSRQSSKQRISRTRTCLQTPLPFKEGVGEGSRITGFSALLEPVPTQDRFCVRLLHSLGNYEKHKIAQNQVYLRVLVESSPRAFNNSSGGS